MDIKDFPISPIILQALKSNSKEKAEGLKFYYSTVEDENLWSFSRKNRLTPVMAHALADYVGWENLPDRWRQLHEETRIRISSYLEELDRVAAILADFGIEVIVIENAALARAVFPCVGCFNFGDLDLLIRPNHLVNVHDILLSQGYKPDRSYESLSSDMPNFHDGRVEYTIGLGSGKPLRLNLQNSFVARRWFNESDKIDFNAVFSRAVLIAGSAALMLSPEDNLLQLSLHNAAHGYVRPPGISLHLDIEQFVRRVPIDWDKFINLIERSKCKTNAYFSLAIPKALFETPIPDTVLARLRPAGWKEGLISRWLQRVGLFNPDEPKFSKLGYVLFTSLLYDDIQGLLRGIFPGRDWMQQRYGFRNGLLLPYYHGRRLLDLACRQ